MRAVYVGILVSAGPNIGYATEDQYKAMDVKRTGQAMTEIAKRTFGEHGVKLVYHPLSEEFNAATATLQISALSLGF